MIKLIWAMDKNRLIGSGDKLPWHKPEDLRFLNKNIKGKNVLVGLNTYRSMKNYYKNKKMPFGTIYLLSNEKIDKENLLVIDDIKSIIKKYGGAKSPDIYIIGGASVYKQFLKYADELIITIVSGEYRGDTFFPDFSYKRFKLVTQNYNNTGLLFSVYRRKKWYEI